MILLILTFANYLSYLRGLVKVDILMKERGENKYKRNKSRGPGKPSQWNYKKKKEVPGKEGAKHPGKSIRLNKLIANRGLCSRREADELIKAGVVTVNGKPVTEMGVQVMPEDDVRVNNERVKSQKKVYILMNKPKDYVTTTRDPHSKNTVLSLVGNAAGVRVYPVGRLDRNTTGVLLLTNDGELTSRLTHPRYNKRKIYHVHLDKNLKNGDMMKIANGIELEDGFIAVDSISLVDESDKQQVGVEIHSGRNRIIRRIFEHLSYKVKKLDRVYFAGLTKKGVPRGKWRFLNEQEISKLKMGSYR